MGDLMVVEKSEIVGIEDYAMPLDSLMAQVKLIQQVQQEVMKPDEHYGIIPGTKKNTLFKSGAEKLCMVFRLSPDYIFINEIREASLVSYTVKCVLTHIQTGQIVANGIGSCNSREDKYRYTTKNEVTDRPIPSDYWNAKNLGNYKDAQKMIGGLCFKAAKNDEGRWMIAKAEKIENDNAFNIDNTVTKMACKRALVAATLNATAASDIFTQDLDDITVKKDIIDAKVVELGVKMSPEYKEIQETKKLFPEEYEATIQAGGGEPLTAEQCKLANESIKVLVDNKNK